MNYPLIKAWMALIPGQLLLIKEAIKCKDEARVAATLLTLQQQVNDAVSVAIVQPKAANDNKAGKPVPPISGSQA